jgi:hypothetical protein
MSKTMSKRLLDEAIKQTRYYFDVTIPHERKDVQEFIGATEAAYQKPNSGYILADLLSSILTLSGLNRDATNEDIYKVLEVLGWQVTDDEQTECRAAGE